MQASIAVTAAMLVAHPTAAQDHRFEADPVAGVRENFVACEVLLQLQRVIDNPRFLLTGECEPLTAGRRVRIYASRGPYVCIYPEDTIHAVQMDTRESVVQIIPPLPPQMRRPP
jgi:hypothetical protein